jgi:hypothetical protein
MRERGRPLKAAIKAVFRCILQSYPMRFGGAMGGGRCTGLRQHVVVQQDISKEKY